MKLLRIGDRLLNVDLVTDYTLEDNGIMAHFGHDHMIRFTRHDATVLRRWLDLVAVDIAQDEPDEPANHGGPFPRQLPWRDAEDCRCLPKRSSRGNPGRARARRAPGRRPRGLAARMPDDRPVPGLALLVVLGAMLAERLIAWLG